MESVTPEDVVNLIASSRSDFNLDITVDKFDGGVYHDGDLLTVRGKSERNGYLYLIGVLPDGTLTMLYPQSGDDNRVQAKTDFVFPRPDSKYQVRLRSIYGTYHIKAIVTDKPLEFAGWAGPEGETGTGIDEEPTQQAKPEAKPEPKSLKKEIPFRNTPFHWTNTSTEEASRGIIVVYENETHTDVRSIMKTRYNVDAFAQDETVFILIPSERR